jgi:hypothetical protein
MLDSRDVPGSSMDTLVVGWYTNITGYSISLNVNKAAIIWKYA